MEKSCIVCGKMKPSHQKVCSYVCAGKLPRKTNWASIDLLELLKRQSKTAIAESLGITVSAVRNREKRILNEKITKEEFWSIIDRSQESLRITDVAKILGVHKKTVMKWSKRSCCPSSCKRVWYTKLLNSMSAMPD